nr:uncharacterized protein LOC117865711 [Setaria viridis]
MLSRAEFRASVEAGAPIRPGVHTAKIWNGSSRGRVWDRPHTIFFHCCRATATCTLLLLFRRPLKHQVAGQRAFPNKLGPLVDDTGLLDKPLHGSRQRTTRGARARPLRGVRLLPTEVRDGERHQHRYHALDDLLAGLEAPSVADIKICSSPDGPLRRHRATSAAVRCICPLGRRGRESRPWLCPAETSWFGDADAGVFLEWYRQRNHSCIHELPG